MWQNVYMLFDTISQMFIGSLSILINDAVAMRSYCEFIEKTDNPMKEMVQDINLYKIGQFHTATGEFKAEKKYICNIGSLIIERQLKEKEKQKNVKQIQDAV